MATIGSIEPFDEAVEDWPTYVERLEQFFVANNVDTDKQVATLLTLLGPKTYKLLKSLTAPDKPSSKTYSVLVDTLANHLAPKPLTIAERFKYNRRDQQPGESVAQYLAVLKSLASTCDFQNTLDDMLRDRLVCGISSEVIRKRLLSEPKLTLKKAYELAISLESATAANTALSGSSANTVHAVNVRKWKPQSRGRFSSSEKPSADASRMSRVSGQASGYTKTQRYKPPKPQQTKQGDSCYRCLGQHNPRSCPYREETCHFCSRKGHLERACRNKQRQRAQKTRHVNEWDYREPSDLVTDDYEYSESEDEEPLYVVKDTASNTSPIKVTVNIEGQPVDMELDTGSSSSIMPVYLYNKQFAHVPLEPTTVMFEGYFGQHKKPLGKVSVTVNYNDQVMDLPMFVIDSNGPPLFGRTWLENIKLDWHQVKYVNCNKSNSVQMKIDALLKKHKTVFEEGLGHLKGITAKLHIDTAAQPKFFRPRPEPYALRPKISRDLDKMEAEGILSRVQHSDWATPIVPVQKGDGTLRICGDFKVTINPVLKEDHYPLPKIEDIFASLAGGQSFSKIDLARAYLQMDVDEDSKKYLTINTSQGLYRYNRLVYGLSTAPALWQRAIDQVLHGLPGVQVYLDDILITGASNEEHLNNLDRVLTRLEEYGLRVKQSKCEWFKPEVSYLGHRIDASGLHTSEDKVKAILEAPAPKDLTQLQSFLGLLNYYGRFLPKLSTVVAPLNRLRAKDAKYIWTSECESAFQRAKQLVVSNRVLTHYDPQKPIKLDCDASAYGIGAVISHVFPDGSEHPVAFASRSLTSAERKYAQIDREALALVYGVKKFHQYLYARKFVLVTDHKPLTALFSPTAKTPPLAAARMQRWAIALSAYDYTIQYRNTKEHCNADALSRLPCKSADKPDKSVSSTFHMAEMDVSPVTINMLQTETRRDKVLSRVYDATLNGWHSSAKNDLDFKPYFHRQDEISIEQGILVWGLRTIVPTKLRSQVLAQLHLGHVGVVKMKTLARSYFWWPGLDKDIESMAKQCHGCQTVQNAPAPAILHPWEFPEGPWRRIHVDYAGPFMGHMFLVVVDAYSKWPEIMIARSISAEETVTMLRSLFASHGLPEQLISDNGTQFTSTVFKDFLKKNGVKHITSAPYKPSTNGLAERQVQSFKQSLRASKRDSGTLQQKLDSYLLAYRNAPHSTTGVAPAVLLRGNRLRTRLDLLKPSVRNTVASKQADMIIRRGGSKVRNFEIGKSVLVRDYRNRENREKWKSGVVIEQTGPVSYKVDVGHGLIWRRHQDQIRSSVPDVECENPESVVLDSVSEPSDTSATTDIVVSSSAIVCENSVAQPAAGIQRSKPNECGKSTDLESVRDTSGDVRDVPVVRRSERTRKPVQKLNL